MAHFYGTVRGGRGESTRTGSKGSGITASVQSWDGSATVSLDDDEAGTRLTLQVREGSGVGGREVLDIPLSDLLTIAKDGRELIAQVADRVEF